MTERLKKWAVTFTSEKYFNTYSIWPVMLFQSSRASGPGASLPQSAE